MNVELLIKAILKVLLCVHFFKFATGQRCSLSLVVSFGLKTQKGVKKFRLKL